MRPGTQPTATWALLALAAALLGFSAVFLGAAGSHAIDLGDASAARRWQIALQIHYFQAAALLALAALIAARSTVAFAAQTTARLGLISGHRALLLAGWLQLLGTLLFCASLYLRALQIETLPRWLTPLGGLILLGGWLQLVLSLAFELKRKASQPNS